MMSREKMDSDNYLSNLTKSDLLELIINEVEGLSVADQNGRYVYVNQKFTEIIGYSLDEVRGKYVRDFFPVNLMDKVLDTGEKIVSVPYRVLNKRKEIVQLVVSYFPIWHHSALVGCIFLIFINNMDQVVKMSVDINDLLEELSYYREVQSGTNVAKYSLSNITGSSDIVKAMKKSIVQAARTISTVLIEGETGSGKELVANAIHFHSSRSANAFIKVNCAAIPKDLLESEFFGYEAGAFTGASKYGKKGKFELANGGTLFLDEINQLPLELQAKLLRAIQEKEIERVGALKSTPVDCRLVVASNVSLESLVADGKFREDLYYRLNVVNIRVPSLRERKEDIPLLADTLLEHLNEQMNMHVPGISNSAKDHLLLYNWPGNVRELQNVIERAMNIAWNETITWQHLKHYFKKADMENLPSTMSIRKKKYELEQVSIREALQYTGGNKSRAAEVLKISRGMLYKKMKKYGM